MSSSVFEDYNHTELHQLCQRIGIRVPVNTSRIDLVQYLECNTEYDESLECEVDSWRRGIMHFLLDHWADVKLLLTCPAASGDPDSCFQCTDVVVAYCASDVQQNSGQLVKISKKPKEQVTMTTNAVFTVESAPRSVEELQGGGRYRLRRLADLIEVEDASFFGTTPVDRPAGKAAFLLAEPNVQAQRLCAWLVAYDKSKGIAAPKAAVVVPPSPAPVVQEEPQVLPQATVFVGPEDAAPPTPQPATAPGKREPRTRTRRAPEVVAEAAPAAVQVTAPVSAAPSNDLQVMGTAIDTLTTVLKSIRTQVELLTAKLDDSDRRYAQLHNAMVALTDQVTSLTADNTLMLGMLQLQNVQLLSDGDAVEGVVEDALTEGALVRQAVPGKG